MSELRDYQRMFVNNLACDLEDILRECGKTAHIEELVDKMQDKIESRITTYDRERWDAIEQAFPTAMIRALQEIRC